tara:strand:+ start:657 stop:782 length:126 start_codon:yes stop_codon:yes gene_type:complete
MIKKTLIILFISIISFSCISCGKKSNPMRDGEEVKNPLFKK